ncbi:MAG: chromosome segregation protein SMC, partial [Eubacterium sp.]|nr:chromosome segregation protein SMC [Eubacterium sp.]
EEAAGISRFRHKRRDSERRLEQAQENLVRLLDILGELESRVKPLKTQSEKAKKFLEFSEEKKTLEIGVWLNKINAFTKNLREQEHKLDAANASYEVCVSTLEKIEKETQEIFSAIAEVNMLIEQSRQGSAAFEEEALKMDGEAKVLLTTLNHNNETIERLSGEISSSDDWGASIDDSIDEKNSFIVESEMKIAQKREELKEVAGEIEKVQSDNEQINHKSVELNQLITKLTLEISDCKVRCSQAISSIEEINSRIETIDETLENCDKDINDAAAAKKESEENLAFLKERIEEYENSMGGYQLKLKTKTERAEKLRSDIEALERKLSEKQSRARMLTDLEKNMEGYSGAVKAVIKQSQAKALSGIHGVLSKLISVPNEYSNAIEVALGAAMQNIVVSSESDAKRAINFLKQNSLGRATFLPINAIKPRTIEESGLDDNFGFIDIASNIVECDNQYKDIISNLLGRVIIAEDIDCAIGISKKYRNKYKIVTLDGQVMNPGGSMTGGSRSKGAGVLSRANTIEELNSEAEKIAAELDEISKVFKTAMEEANKAGADLQGADADLRNAKEDYIRAEGDDKLLGDRVNSLVEQKNALLAEKENSSSRIKAYEEANASAEKQSGEIQLKIDEAEAELSSISTGADELSAKREEFRNRANDINLELVTLAKDCEAAKLAIEELELRKNTQSDRVQTISVEIEEIKKRNESLSLSIADIENRAKELRDKAKNSDEGIKDLISKRDELEKRSGALRDEEKKGMGDKESISAELVRIEERKNAMTREYDELNDMLFEQYELTKVEAQNLGIVIEDMTAAKRRLTDIKASIRALGSVNVGAIEEYKEVSERYEFLKEQISDVEKAKSELLNIIQDLTSSMSEKFMESFKKINEAFKLSFSDFFGGGRGEIILENPDDCLESPIEIKIQPPGKSVQNINLFSGGEKSLAAMALLFSVLKVTPSPFCIYDEVEAALDDVNVERFAKYMRKMTDRTQFISITHRRGTMEEADVLYGVTMQEKGVSKLLELQSAELAEKMGLE